MNGYSKDVDELYRTVTRMMREVREAGGDVPDTVNMNPMTYSRISQGEEFKLSSIITKHGEVKVSLDPLCPPGSIYINTGGKMSDSIKDYGFEMFGDSFVFRTEGSTAWFSITEQDKTIPEIVQYAMSALAREARKNGYRAAVEEYVLGEDWRTKKLKELVNIGGTADGADHKQWCLIQIAKEIQVDTSGLDEGTVP